MIRQAAAAGVPGPGRGRLCQLSTGQRVAAPRPPPPPHWRLGSCIPVPVTVACQGPLPGPLAAAGQKGKQLGALRFRLAPGVAGQGARTGAGLLDRRPYSAVLLEDVAEAGCPLGLQEVGGQVQVVHRRGAGHPAAQGRPLRSIHLGWEGTTCLKSAPDRACAPSCPMLQYPKYRIFSCLFFHLVRTFAISLAPGSEICCLFKHRKAQGSSNPSATCRFVAGRRVRVVLRQERPDSDALNTRSTAASVQQVTLRVPGGGFGRYIA